MQLFYTPDISGNNYTLNEDESKHCMRVLRLGVGSFIHLTDGRGTLHKAVIIDDNPKRCAVEIVETTHNYGKRNCEVHIALAPTKNMDRTEWFLEKCCEIGFDRYVPLECFHSERRAIKTDRCMKVLTSGVKQSLKAYHPVVDELTRFEKLVKDEFDGLKLIAHCNASQDKKPLKEVAQGATKILILIGPEGDFSTEEVELAKSYGFCEVSLGESRLRTETAGVVACHTINLMNE